MSNTTVLQLRSIRYLLDKLRPELTGKTLARLTAMLDVMSPAGTLSLERALQVTFDHIPAEGRLKQFTNFLSDINAGIKEAGITDTTIAVLGGKFDRPADRTVVFHGPDQSGARASEHTRKTTQLPPRQPDVDNDLQPDARTQICVFLSYAHDDSALVNKLRGMLAPHLNGDPDFRFITWMDNQILAGEKWDTKIGSALADCNMGFFMASASFCTSKYIISKELKHFQQTGKPFILIGANKCDLKLLKRHGLDEHQVFLFSRQAGAKGRWFSELTTAPDKREFVLQLAEQITQRIKQNQPPPCPAQRDGDATDAPSLPAYCADSSGTMPAQKNLRNPRNPRAKTHDHYAKKLAASDPNQIPDGEHLPSDAQPEDFGKPLAKTSGERQELHTHGGRVGAQEFILKWACDPFSTPYFVLLGEAGVGKTTTLQKLASHLLRERVADPRLPLPIYIDLRNFTGRPAANAPIKVEQVIQDAISRAWNTTEDSGFTPADALQLVREGGALILFDGLDEKIVHLEANLGVELIQALWSALPPGSIHEDREARAAGRTDLPNRGKILISCRSHYFRDLLHQANHFIGHGREIISTEDYSSATILPFSEAQIAEYLGKFLGHDKVNGALEVIRRVHNLADLAPRPLLLKTIAKHIPKLEADMAAGRSVRAASLYDYMVEDWLDRDTGKHVIESDHKPWFMEQIAASLWRTGEKRCSWKTLHGWFDELLAENATLASAYSGKDRTTLKDDLRTATFLVRKDAPDEHTGKKDDGFRFAHTSMQEYFLARYLYAALVEQRRNAWAMSEPSLETFDFLGDLLVLRDDSALALEGLAALLETNTRKATRNAFRYWVRAMENDAPQPQPTRVALAGEDLGGWRVGARSSERGFPSPVSPEGAAKSIASMDTPRTRNDAGTPAGVHGAIKAPLRCRIPSLDLTGAILADSEWQNIALPGVKFAHATATGALFRHCDLTDAAWARADFAGGDLIHCTGLPEPLPTSLKAAWCVPGNTAAFAKKPRTLQGGDNAPIQLACAWSPDGTQVLSASYDHTLRVWEPRTGKVLHVLHGHTGWVSGCAWSPNGTQVLSTSNDHTLRVWEPRTGKVLHVLHGHTDSVRGCAWSPDGTQVLSASDDYTLRVWEPRTGNVLHVLRGHTGWLYGCAWSPDGTQVLSASDDYTLRVWEPRSGNVLHVLHGHTGPVRGCAWSPDGTQVLSASADKTLRVWEPRSGKVLHVLHGHADSVNGCAWSPDVTQVLSASGDKTLRVWAPLTGKVLHVLHGHTAWVRGCAWSPDGSAVLSASYDGTLRIWDAATQRPTLALLTPHNAPGAAVDLTRNVLITDAGGAWRNWRWSVEGAPRTLPLEAFTAP